MERNTIPDDYIVPFGKFSGEKIGNVPARYLLYMYENVPMKGSLFARTKQYIEENIDDLRNEVTLNK